MSKLLKIGDIFKFKGNSNLDECWSTAHLKVINIIDLDIYQIEIISGSGRLKKGEIYQTSDLELSLYSYNTITKIYKDPRPSWF